MIKRDRIVYTIDLGGSEEAKALSTNLDNYIALTGETKKWFVLQGMARLIGEAEDNPKLVLQIAEYLAGVKRGRPTND